MLFPSIANPFWPIPDIQLVLDSMNKFNNFIKLFGLHNTLLGSTFVSAEADTRKRLPFSFFLII